MTQLSYYGTPEAAVPHRGGLIAWGAVMISVGAILSCFGLLGMVALVFMSTQNINGGASTPAAMRGVSAMFVAIGMYGALIWLGIGCCLRKRWVRPLVLVGSVIAIVAGLVSIVPTTWSMITMLSRAVSPSATTAPTMGPDPQIMGAIGGIIGVVMMFAALIVVPTFAFRFFRKESVKQSLEMSDPLVRWTDNVPLPILGWAVGCVGFGFSYGLNGLTGAAPFFTRIITGPMAIFVMAILGLLLIVGGWLSYRRSTLGWAMTISATAFMAVSFWTFGVAGDADLYRKILLSGFGPAVQKSAADSMAAGVSPAIVPAILFTIAVGYGIWLRPRVTR